MLIARGHQLKKVVCLSWCQARVSHLINDENTRGGVATEPLTHQARIGSGIQGLSQMGERGKQRRIPSRQSFDSKRQAQVCFPNARGSQKNHVGGGLDKGEIGQFPEPPFGEAGLKGKIKGLQRFERWQTSCSHPPLSCSPISSLNLGPKSAGEEQFIGPLFLPCCLKEGRQDLLQLG